MRDCPMTASDHVSMHAARSPVTMWPLLCSVAGAHFCTVQSTCSKNGTVQILDCEQGRGLDSGHLKF